MSVSTDGIICYGIMIGETRDFPWFCDEYYDDPEEWWICEICGYKNPVEIFDENGNYINGKPPSKEDHDLYYNSKFKFKKEHPIPIDVVYTCCDACAEFIIAVPGSVMSARRGDPIVFDPEDLKVSMEQHNKLVDFCRKYLDVTDEDVPKWYLASYWG